MYKNKFRENNYFLLKGFVGEEEGCRADMA